MSNLRRFVLVVSLLLVPISLWADMIRTEVIIDEFAIKSDSDGYAVFECNFDEVSWLSSAGEPQIPWKVTTVLLPVNAILSTAKCVVANQENIVMQGRWQISPMPVAFTYDNDNNIVYDWPVDADIQQGYDVGVYQANKIWPAKAARIADTGKLERWQLVEIAVPMARYNPVTGQLSRQLAVSVEIEFETTKAANATKSPAVPANARITNKVKALADNFTEQADSYNASTLSVKDGDILPLGGVGQYTIITSNEIATSSTKLNDFIAHKQSRGFNVQLITEDDFGQGTGDTAATNIRAWLQANYQADGIEYLLLIGNPVPTEGYVPMKLYPCGERNIPTDYFYAELTADWDANGNGIIGESGEIERYFEIYVGRIPHYGDMTITDAILEKTINYENSEDTNWRRNVLIPIVPLDTGTSCYNLGEQIKYDLLEPDAIASARLYRDGYGFVASESGIIPPPEFPASKYPATAWAQGDYGMVIWSTHGWSKGASGIIGTGDTYALDDGHPSTTFQGSCETAYPYHDDNLTYSLLKNGGIGTIGATRNAYYYGQTNFRNSPTAAAMGYYYAKGVAARKSNGQALYDLKEEISSWWTHNWTLFNLYGDPSVVVLQDPPVMTISPTHNSYVEMVRGEEISKAIEFTIANNTDNNSYITVSKSQDWLTMPISAGMIGANSSYDLPVSIDSSVAETLAVGTYTDTIVFTDTDNHIVVERGFTLVVKTTGLKGYWKLDEAEGTSAADYSGFDNNGSLAEEMELVSQEAVFGNAMYFDGVDDYINVSDISVNSNKVTISAWIKTDGIPADRDAIFFTRSGQASGLGFNDGNTLSYHWRNTNHDWDSGLEVPDNTWTFVALVIEPDKATMYMYAGAGLETSIHYANHEPDSFMDGDTNIGRDSTDNSRCFKGYIDDVRIYDFAADINTIVLIGKGGPASNPKPENTQQNVSGSTLSWIGNPAATGYDVYMGSSADVIANATTDSDEYSGRITETQSQFTFKPNSKYFWRVDIVTENEILPGALWQFNTGDGTGMITREIWTDIAGGDYLDLLNSPKYDTAADYTQTLTTFETSTNFADNYGSRIHGFLVPKVSGVYSFWIAGDDGCALGLSPDTNPDNVALIAQVPGYTSLKQWDKYTEQRSIKKPLIAGKHYYIIAVHKEGGGGDHVAVAWQGPDFDMEVIAGEYLVPYRDDHNAPPFFQSNPVILDRAVANSSYNANIANMATDPEGTAMTFDKASGPDWLIITDDGTIEGTPTISDIGINAFVVDVADADGITSKMTVQIEVIASGNLEGFALIAKYWLNSDCCGCNQWCQGADITSDGIVDLDDLDAFITTWMIDN
ncbi:MAG: hypothetical protein JEZ07_04015 [Phycisphaerae bacterium]|nr:hypothetical protein [Phycisphaerae bacterium]